MAGSVSSLLASLEDDQRDWLYRSIIFGVLNVPPRGFSPVWLSCDLVHDAAISPFRRLAGHDATLTPAAVRVVAESCIAWAAERVTVPMFAQFAALPYYVLGVDDSDDYEMDSDDEAFWAAQDAKLSTPVLTRKPDVTISGDSKPSWAGLSKPEVGGGGSKGHWSPAGDSLGVKGGPAALDVSKWEDLTKREIMTEIERLGGELRGTSQWSKGELLQRLAQTAVEKAAEGTTA